MHYFHTLYIIKYTVPLKGKLPPSREKQIANPVNTDTEGVLRTSVPINGVSKIKQVEFKGNVIFNNSIINRYILVISFTFLLTL